MLGPTLVRPGQTLELEHSFLMRILGDEVALGAQLRKAKLRVQLRGTGQLALGTGSITWPATWTGQVPVAR